MAATSRSAGACKHTEPAWKIGTAQDLYTKAGYSLLRYVARCHLTLPVWACPPCPVNFLPATGLASQPIRFDLVFVLSGVLRAFAVSCFFNYCFRVVKKWQNMYSCGFVQFLFTRAKCLRHDARLRQRFIFLLPSTTGEE